MTPPTICSLPFPTLLRICELILSEDSKTRPLPRNLLSLALSCRSLSEPALDTIWHTIPALTTLLTVLPKDLYTFDPELPYECTKHERTHLSSRPVLLWAPKRKEIVRCTMYAQRVKAIGPRMPRRDPLSGEPLSFPEPGSTEDITSAVWAFLLVIMPMPLFPNLQSLHHWKWECCRSNFRRTSPIHSPGLFFGSKLESADIGCVDPSRDPDHATDLVRTLSDAAFGLKHLSIETKPDDPESTVTGSLRRPDLRLFSQLTSFSGSTVRVGPRALEALASLPCLESLLLHVDPAEYPWGSYPRWRHASFFPALQQLTLHKIDFHWSTAFLRTLPSKSLRKLSLRCEPAWTPHHKLFRSVCAAIATLPSASSIVEVSLTVGVTIYDTHGPPTVNFGVYFPDDVAPLFTLPALRRLVIKGCCVVSVDDFSLYFISKNCPDLEELTLEWNRLHPPRYPDSVRSEVDDDFPCVTPIGLLDLARSCPRLRTLAVAFNMDQTRSMRSPDRPRFHNMEVAPRPPVAFEGPGTPALLELDATGSVLGENPERIAALLSLMFPRLLRVTSYFDSPEWQDVPALQASFARIRSQERARAAKEGRRYLDAAVSM